MILTDEVVLLQRIAQKDQGALSQLYDRYGRILFALAYRIVRSTEESEEVVTDVFLQVWRIAGTYNTQKARVDTWLFMLTRSRSLDRLRRLRKEGKEVKAAQAIPLITPPLEEAIFQTERREQVKSALAQIPDDQRQVLEMSYFGGMSHAQIAMDLNLPLGTIKTRIRLGIKKLRQIFTPD